MMRILLKRMDVKVRQELGLVLCEIRIVVGGIVKKRELFPQEQWSEGELKD